MGKMVTCVDLEGKTHRVAMSELTWRPSAYGLVIRDDQVLVIVDHKGRFALPGGGIDLGELPENAVVREVKEETGYIVDNIRLLACGSSLFKLPDFYGGFVQSILLYYRCDVVGGELSMDTLPAEDRAFHGESRWLPISELGSLPSAATYDWQALVKEVHSGQNHRH